MTNNDGIMEKELYDVASKGFVDFALNTITNRAISDVRDGLKPVSRKVLYAMHELGLTVDKPHKKSARIVGDTMGKYHPHGDSSIYGALVTCTQDFRENIPLIDGHGNFGSIDDGAAAMRYTEARLSEYGMYMLEGLDEDAVDFVSNFDESETEPLVLPAFTPNLLVNGDFGMAVGYQPNIPPHNYGELIDGIVYQIDNPNATTKELMKFVKGPDFPEGCILNPTELETCYETGKGKIPMRAKLVVEPLPLGKQQIVISEVPYLVSKEKLKTTIAKLLNDPEYCFDEIIDETDKNGTRIAIVFNEGANINQIIDLLYKKTQLETNFSYNFIAIKDGMPLTFSLHDYFETFIETKMEVLKRILTFRVTKEKKALYRYNALLIGALNIDKVIKIIKSSKTTKIAKENLCKELNIDLEAAQIILEIRLSSLINTEINALKQNIKDVEKRIKTLEKTLSSDKNIQQALKEKLLSSKDKFASPRKSTIKKFEKLEVIIQANEFTLQAIGRKFNKLSSDYKGNKGISIKVKSNDIVYAFMEDGTLHKFLANNIVLEEPSNIVGLFTECNNNIFFVTTQGMVKQLKNEDIKNVANNKQGVLAMKLQENEKIVGCFLANDEQEIAILSQKGMCIKFIQGEVNPTGRVAGGVKGLVLDKNDTVIKSSIIDDKDFVISALKLQKRGGKGCKYKNK